MTAVVDVSVAAECLEKPVERRMPDTVDRQACEWAASLEQKRADSSVTVRKKTHRHPNESYSCEANQFFHSHSISSSRPLQT